MAAVRLNKSKKCFKRIRRHCYISERLVYSGGLKGAIRKQVDQITLFRKIPFTQRRKVAKVRKACDFAALAN